MSRDLLWPGFALVLVGTVLQRCGSAACLGAGVAAVIDAAPGWHWWFVAAAGCFITGTTVVAAAYRWARKTTRR